MTKRRWIAFLAMNPQAALAMGWKLLGALAESWHYDREERRRSGVREMDFGPGEGARYER